MSTKTAIFFIEVTNVASKLQAICKTVHKHFEKRERVQISVGDAASASYIDQLLWKIPEESFLPHAIIDTPSAATPIAITAVAANLNQATVLINLAAGPSSIIHLFQTAYELLDHTAPTKKELSQKRYATYQAAGYPISILSIV